MSIITRINKAEKRIVDLYNKLKNLPSGGGGVQTISGDFVDNTDPLNPILNDPRPYKVYTALLNQSGTDAPVATVLENTLDYIPTYVYGGVGTYSIMLQDTLFSEIVLPTMSTLLTLDTVILIRPEDDNLITINTPIDSVPTDEVLVTFFIEIRVYN